MKIQMVDHEGRSQRTSCNALGRLLASARRLSLRAYLARKLGNLDENRENVATEQMSGAKSLALLWLWTIIAYRLVRLNRMAVPRVLKIRRLMLDGLRHA